MVKLSVKLVMSLLLLGVLVFAMTAPALAGGAQDWYLDSTAHTVTGSKVMTKTWGDTSGSVTITGGGGSQIWLADEAALVDVTFPDGAWVIQLKTDGYWGEEFEDCSLAAGEWDITDSTFYPFSTTTENQTSWDVEGQYYIMTIELQTEAATVHEDNYLALQVTNDDSSDHTVYTDGESSLKSPDSDPGYPVPEIVSGVLFGIGLFGLLGYIGLKRRKKARARA